jgi:lipopolysaccharide/colanic/teichoic acid biosynthesis glycosyltransferase
MLTPDPNAVRWVHHPLKRLLDAAFALLLLVILSPLLLLLAVCVRLTLGSPVFFRQIRPGKNGDLFTLVKFRSLREGPGSDAERMTPFGRFLRASSLDELPELWNILRGDMSFIGPRPLLPQYLDRYSPEQARRHDVRPGLSGWAQVNGRNALSWEDKFRLDVWYVDHASFWTDLRIVAMTLQQILTRARGAEPAEEFKPEGKR